MTSTVTPVPAEVTAPLTADSIGALSAFYEDTPWMRARREAAGELYSAAPMPSRRDEHWRFTNLRGIDLAAVPAFTPASDEDAVRARVADGLALEPVSGHLVHVNGATVAEDLTGAAPLPAGVVFCSLDRALTEHAELVERWWGTVVSPTASPDDKFVALQEASFSNGLFLYVPRGVEITEPFRASIVHSADGAHVNWRALVVLEEGARAELVEEFISTDPALEGFSNAVVELVAGQASRLDYTTVQDLASPVVHFATHRLVAQRDAQVEWNAIGLGAARGKARMEVRLAGAGAHVKLTGAYFADGRQELDYDTQQVHEAPNAYSDLSFRGVLTDRARSVWRGTIDVAEGAQGTDSYQENRNLLLSSSAHADSIPGLQIEANEVRCTHGATISKVDQEQLFYLQARGIPAAEATRMIVKGFLHPSLERITDESLREVLRAALAERMDGAVAGS